MLTSKPIRSVIMNGGQGDVIMAACGLHAIKLLLPQALSDDLVCYTRSFIMPVVAKMLPEFTVQDMGNTKNAVHPRYYTSAKTSGSTIRRNLLGADYYVNFAAGRRRASFGQADLSTVARLGQFLDRIVMGRSLSWRRTAPSYYGLQMWAPLAERFGNNEIGLLRGLHHSFPILRERLRDYARSLSEEVVLSGGLAIFPVGRSFQTIDPGFLARLLDGVPSDAYRCYFPAGDTRMTAYEGAGISCAIVNTPEAFLRLMVDAEAVIACDSLPSHLAQLLASKCLILASHDLPQHTVHPAADARVVFVAMPCVPCSYVHIDQRSTCMKGNSHCGVFDDPAYFAAAKQWLAALSPSMCDSDKR